MSAVKVLLYNVEQEFCISILIFFCCFSPYLFSFRRPTDKLFCLSGISNNGPFLMSAVKVLLCNAEQEFGISDMIFFCCSSLRFLTYFWSHFAAISCQLTVTGHFKTRLENSRKFLGHQKNNCDWSFDTLILYQTMSDPIQALVS